MENQELSASQNHLALAMEGKSNADMYSGSPRATVNKSKFNHEVKKNSPWVCFPHPVVCSKRV